MKVRTRILVAFLVIGVLGFFYLLNRVNQAIRPVYLESIEDDLVEIATLLSSFLALESANGTLATGSLDRIVNHVLHRKIDVTIYDRHKTDLDLRIYVTNTSGIVVFDSDDGKALGKDYSSWNDVSRSLQGEYGARSTWEKQGDINVLVLYVASPVVVGGRRIGALTVGKPTPVAYSFYKKVRREAFFAVSLTMAFGILCTLFVTLWVTRPIQALKEYAENIRDGRPVTLPALGKSDIASLGQAFDEMRDALEGKRYVEQFVQTLTHEIKSPLSAIKGASELLEGDMPEERRIKFLNNIRTESERIQRIVDRLLKLSALEAQKSLRASDNLDVAAIIQELLERLQPLIQSKEIQVVFNREPTARLKGERFLIRLALSNLLQNALEFTPPYGKIQITLAGREVRIRDSGPGIPEYAIERVFERFYSLQRADSGKKSSGLGLSIVKRIAELHHGEAILRNCTDQGAEAIFRFAA